MTQEHDLEGYGKSQPNRFYGQYDSQSRPVIRILVSTSMQNTEIMKLFDSTLRSQHFELIEANGDQSTAVQTRILNCTSCFVRCFSWVGSLTEPFTVIRLNILPSKDCTSKLVIMRGLAGNDKTIQRCLEILNKEFLAFKKSGKNSSNNDSPLYKPTEEKAFFQTGPGDTKGNNSIQGPLDKGSELEIMQAEKSKDLSQSDRDSPSSISQGNNIYTDFAIDDEEENGKIFKGPGGDQGGKVFALYYFAKILNESQNAASSNLHKFIQEFQEKNSQPPSMAEVKNAQFCIKKMETITKMVARTEQLAFKDKGVHQRKLMPYSSIATEKYLFDKIYDCVLGLYKEKFSNLESDFKASQESLRKRSVQELFTSLEIKKRFWLVKEGEIDAAIDIKRHPYYAAVRELDTTQHYTAPREKLERVLLAYSKMKIAVTQFYKGKQEIEAMDDELPIAIFLVVFVQNPTFVYEILMIEDYMRRDEKYEIERRTLINFKGAIEYIANEWRIEGNEKESG